jgi:phosphoesterase RecJ-like protein
MMKNEIKFNFRKAWELIGKSRHIFMTTHENTDGDDLGSLLALKLVLEQKGKAVSAAVSGGVPEALVFLPKSNQVGDTFVDNDYDLIITFGCSSIERPGFSQIKHTQIPIINFDHHQDNHKFGKINIVDQRTAAVAELIYYFLEFKDLDIDKDIATCLLTGIYADTGGFKHSNTSAEVLTIAAHLLKKGARIDKIAVYTYGRNRPQTMKAWSKALENTQYNRQKDMVFSVVTDDELKDLGATDEDLAGFVTLLNHVREAKFALLLRQEGDMIKGSLRSEEGKNTDVAKIAKSFGGGGHKLSAGFKVKGRIYRKGNDWEVE